MRWLIFWNPITVFRHCTSRQGTIQLLEWDCKSPWRLPSLPHFCFFSFWHRQNHVMRNVKLHIRTALKRFLWVGAMNAECASNVMSLICNSWYARVLFLVFLDSILFVFIYRFSTRCFFFCSFDCVKGIGNAPRLTGNSFNRKQTLSSIGSPPLRLLI